MNLLENLHNHKLPANQVFVAIQNAFLCPSIRLFIAEDPKGNYTSFNYLILDNMKVIDASEQVSWMEVGDSNWDETFGEEPEEENETKWWNDHITAEINKDGHAINEIKDPALVPFFDMRGQHGLSLSFNTLANRKFKDIENLPDALKKAARQINDLDLDTSKPQAISTYLAWQENANKILREYWPTLGTSKFPSHEDMVKYFQNKTFDIKDVYIGYQHELGENPSKMRLFVYENKGSYREPTKIRYLDNCEVEFKETARKKHFLGQHEERYVNTGYYENMTTCLFTLDDIEEFGDYICAEEDVMHEINHEKREWKNNKATGLQLLEYQDSINSILSEYWQTPKRDQKWPVNVFENPKAKEPEMER